MAKLLITNLSMTISSKLKIKYKNVEFDDYPEERHPDIAEFLTIVNKCKPTIIETIQLSANIIGKVVHEHFQNNPSSPVVNLDNWLLNIHTLNKKDLWLVIEAYISEYIMDPETKLPFILNDPHISQKDKDQIMAEPSMPSFTMVVNYGVTRLLFCDVKVVGFIKNKALFNVDGVYLLEEYERVENK